MARRMGSKTASYRLNGMVYTIDEQAKLGAGSEGTVYADPKNPDLCAKILHPPEPDNLGAERLAEIQSRRIQAICRLGLHLPPQFALPMASIMDMAEQRAVGFQMQRVPATYFGLSELLKSSFRINQQFGLGPVATLFADLFDDLYLLHNNRLVIGDVNLGCIMFEPHGRRAWVDTASWSYPGFPCLATTELFAHPDLYPNLSAGGRLIEPEPRHDRFAFTVAFTQLAIPGAHPFTMGMHPTVHGVQDRTKAGLTIFDKEVKYPPRLGSREVLSDELLQMIIERLKRQTDAPLDTDYLREFAQEVRPCRACGLEYHSSRSTCPNCRQVTLVQRPSLAGYMSRGLMRGIMTLLFAQVIDGNVYMVCRLGDRVEVQRLDQQGSVTSLLPYLPSIRGARYRFFRDCLVVCPHPNSEAPVSLELYRIQGDSLRPLPAVTTGVLEGDGATFGVSSRFLYRTAGNALLRGELYGRGVLTETQIAEVFQRQTWFTVDRSTGAEREVVFGCDRALREWQWFVLHGNADGSNFRYHQIDGLSLRSRETVEDVAVYFSAKSVLLVRQTAYRGREFVRYSVIGLDGRVHRDKLVDPADPTYLHWLNLRGKLYQGGSVLHVTPNGIVKQSFTDGSLTTLTGTEKLLGPDDQLIRLNGQLGVVGRGGISVLERS